MRYVDVHSHIGFDVFDADRDALVERMHQKEVGSIVVGVDKQSSLSAVALAREHSHLFASGGLHPNYVTGQDDLSFLQDIQKNIVAVGECGLDYFRPEQVGDALKHRQQEVFASHIRFAGETGLPLMIHARPSKGAQDAYHDLISMLEEGKRTFPLLSGNVHFFVGGIEEAGHITALGFTVSYTAVITFTRDYDDVIRSLPLSHILSETDAPYVAPPPRRGTRNDPLSVRDVVRAVAQIRGEDEEAVRLAILDNAKRVFPLEGRVAQRP